MAPGMPAAIGNAVTTAIASLGSATRLMRGMSCSRQRCYYNSVDGPVHKDARTEVQLYHALYRRIVTEKYGTVEL